MNAQVPYKSYITQEYHAHGYNLQKGTRVAMTLAIRNEIPGTLRSSKLRIGDYAGGRDLGLLEFSESLPVDAYDLSF